MMTIQRINHHGYVGSIVIFEHTVLAGWGLAGIRRQRTSTRCQVGGIAGPKRLATHYIWPGPPFRPLLGSPGEFSSSTSPPILPPIPLTEGGAVNKTELIDRLAKKTGMTKKGTGEALAGIVDVITEALGRGEPVVITGFGKFEPRTRKASVRRNPQTQRKMNVPAKVVPVFRPGKDLKVLVQVRVRAR